MNNIIPHFAVFKILFLLLFQSFDNDLFNEINLYDSYEVLS